MTSKNSFWASLKENNKRRIWLWVISALGFIVVLPTVTALSISRGMSSESYYIESLGEVLGTQTLYELLLARMQRLLGVENIVMWILIAGFAVISAIQGFSYLYNRKKIDFYMGMPVKRSRRFFIIWLNGIVVYLLPYLLGIALSCLIAFMNHAMNGELFLEICKTYGLYFCFYLGIYHLAILAVMLTGNLIITCFGVAVFFLYEWVVRLIIQGYMGLFFHFYSWHGYDSTPLFSPFAILFRYIDALGQKEAASAILTALYLLLFAAVIGLIAYICYLKRPAEAAGKAMAFSLPKPWIKILIVVPATLLSGLVVIDVIGYRPLYGEGKIGYVIFSMAIVLLVSCCLIQVLYEFDIKGILHKKRHVLISAVLTTAIFVVFRFDLIGYDSYIPKAEDVESAAFMSPMDNYSYYGGSYFNENMETLSRYDYMYEYMYLTDIGTINKLMKKSMDAVKEVDSLKELNDSEESEWYQVAVTFRMNNKREVARIIFVDLKDPETVELIDRIESSEEFIAGAYVGASDILDHAIADEKYKIGGTYGNGIYEQRLEEEEMKELLSLYKKDIVNTSFSALRESIPSGSLVISLEHKKENYTITEQAELRIYPFFTECVEYLKEKGYYMENHLNPEDIDRIQVVNYNYDIQEEMQKAQQAEDVEALSASELLNAQAYGVATSASGYGSDDYMDLRKYATYEEETEIRQLSETLYPSSWIYPSWQMNQLRDDNYVVTVYFKPGSDAARNYGSVADYCFIQNEVPVFVEEDTVYTE